MARTVSLHIATEIPPGEGRAVALPGSEGPGTDIAVFRSRSGAVYASQATCPHKGGPLADGLFGGASVVCPLHEKVFDLTTGTCSDGSCTIAVYPIHQSADGQLVVELPN
jgi:nitrite reductase (NADH) small subunit